MSLFERPSYCKDDWLWQLAVEHFEQHRNRKDMKGGPFQYYCGFKGELAWTFYLLGTTAVERWRPGLEKGRDLTVKATIFAPKAKLPREWLVDCKTESFNQQWTPKRFLLYVNQYNDYVAHPERHRLAIAWAIYNPSYDRADVAEWAPFEHLMKVRRPELEKTPTGADGVWFSRDPRVLYMPADFARATWGEPPAELPPAPNRPQQGEATQGALL